MDYYFLVAMGIIWESIVIVIALIMVCLSCVHYIQKRNNLSLLLFFIFLNYMLSIIFSWISKLITFFFRIPYLNVATTPDPRTLDSWILLRISYYRISFCFIVVAILLSFFFREKIFSVERKRNLEVLIVIIGLFELVFALFIFEKEFVLLDVILFFIVFIYMLIVYIPFFVQSFRAYKLTENASFRKAFLSLMLMSISYTSVLLLIFVDRVFIYFGNSGYTLFYFASWFFVILGIIFSYFGYLNLHIP